MLRLVLAALVFGAPRALIASDSVTDSPLTVQQGSPANGRRIVLDRAISACLLCHSGPFPAPHLQGSIGPSLAGVGQRLSPSEIRLRLVDPARFNPNTVMPAYYLTTGLTRVGQPWQGKPVLTAEQIEDVVAYLTTLREP
jgi:sulfur-oxidizing protein SoxX